MVLHCAMYCHLVLVDGPHVGVLHGEGGDLGDLVQADQPGAEDGLHTGANTRQPRANSLTEDR